MVEVMKLKTSAGETVFQIIPKLPDWCWMPGGKTFLRARCRVRMTRFRTVYITAAE